MVDKVNNVWYYNVVKVSKKEKIMKKFLLFLTVAMLAVCFFAIGVSASDVYTTSANGESPLFYLRGYAINEAGGSICVEYDVNLEALEAYKAQAGEGFEYGVVFSLESNLVNGKPLDKDGLAVGEKVYKAKLSDLENSLITLIVHGIEEEQYAETIVMCLYIIDGEGVKYITGDETTSEPEVVSYDVVKEIIENPKPNEPVTPPAPPTPTITEVKVGDITYAIDAVTEPAWDRIKQQNSSIAEYNMGSSSDLSSIRAKANIIALGGWLINLPAASSLMSHYLDNTGTQYNIDIAEFMSDDSGAKSNRNKAINNALRAAEQLAVEGLTLNIGQLTEGHPMQGSLATQNWQYSLGSYFDDVDITNLTVTVVNGVKTYTADITYIVTDFYNWDTNDYNKFKKIVSPHDLHELHRGGVAQEFMSYGEITYKSVTWTEGQTVGQFAGIN